MGVGGGDQERATRTLYIYICDAHPTYYQNQNNPYLDGGFIVFIFIPIWGRFPFWLIFLKPPTRYRDLRCSCESLWLSPTLSDDSPVEAHQPCLAWHFWCQRFLYSIAWPSMVDAFVWNPCPSKMNGWSFSEKKWTNWLELVVVGVGCFWVGFWEGRMPEKTHGNLGKKLVLMGVAELVRTNGVP